MGVDHMCLIYTLTRASWKIRNPNVKKTNVLNKITYSMMNV